MITGFHHVGISVADLERAIAFYRDVFGMEQACGILAIANEKNERIMALPKPAGRMTVVAKGSLVLELFEFSHPRPATKDPDYSVADHGLTHFGFWVDDIEGTYEHMRQAGVRFHSPVLQFEGGIKAAYGRDCDGNVFELLEQGTPVVP